MKWIIAITLALALSLTGCSLAGVDTNPTVVPSSPSVSTPISGQALSIEDRVEAIYEQVNPSVVNIQVVLPPSASSVPLIPGLPQSPRSNRALGSGFVWDTQGHIVTNNHVVADARTITVTFADGTIVPAKLVGADPDSDLAVIKVDLPPSQLRAVKMADSTRVEVGQLSVAIGNPFGLEGTLTVGFVSGLGRLLPADSNSSGLHYSIPDIIQTDASLNPGNSGGVLLDDAGAVIGVTSAIASSAGTSSGVGFAIPSAIVQQVVPELISTGNYEHPWLGVTITTLTPDLNGAMNLPFGQRGALVVAISPDSPAIQAGLKPSLDQATINGEQVRVGGDVVIAIDGQTVRSSDDIIAYLARSGSVGQTVSLTVLRQGKQIKVDVTLKARPRG